VATLLVAFDAGNVRTLAGASITPPDGTARGDLVNHLRLPVVRDPAHRDRRPFQHRNLHIDHIERTVGARG
jgi:hypothetical protein